MADPVVALVADHAGFELKNTLKRVLDEYGFETLDLGPHNDDAVNYPDMAGKLAEALKENCGTGAGITIAANRFPWVRGPRYAAT
jgi:ribose 5-phosphate isomerase B